MHDQPTTPQEGNAVTEPAQNQPTPAPEPAAPAATPQQPAAPDAPPWGDDFDPQKAWTLVQNLRADKEKLANRPALTDEQQQRLNEYNRLVEASKSEEQRRAEAIEAANRERDESRSEALRLRVALKHGITEDDFDLLGSGTEEQIEARAQRIAAKNTAAQQALTQDPVVIPPVPTPRRPTEQLPGGATPTPDPVQGEDAYPTDWLSPAQRARVDARRQ